MWAEIREGFVRKTIARQLNSWYGDTVLGGRAHKGVFGMLTTTHIKTLVNESCAVRAVPQIPVAPFFFGGEEK